MISSKAGHLEDYLFLRVKFLRVVLGPTSVGQYGPCSLYILDVIIWIHTGATAIQQ